MLAYEQFTIHNLQFTKRGRTEETASLVDRGRGSRPFLIGNRGASPAACHHLPTKAMDRTCVIERSPSRVEWLNSVTGCTNEAALDEYSRRSSYVARRQSAQTLKKLVAASRRDFISKCAIALKEARESLFRLRVADRCQLGAKGEAAVLAEEARQLAAIIGSIVRNTRRNASRCAPLTL
jgi:four helix bundle protein